MNIESYSDNTGSLRWEGFAIYTSPDGSRWSNQPFTKEQRDYDKLIEKNYLFSEKVIKLVSIKGFTLKQIVDRIKEGTSTLSKKTQQWVLEHYYPDTYGHGRGTTLLPNM